MPMENLSYVAEKVTIIEPMHGTILTDMTIINRRYDLCSRMHNRIYIYTHKRLRSLLENLASVLSHWMNSTYVRILYIYVCL